MFPRVGPTELIILLVIVLLIFGPGRIAKIAGELGKGIRSFKEGVNSDEESEDEQTDEKESDEK
ncbi:MAG: twin-arginine translocase TatA/TatE family subunit [Anaerolineales bacterium]|jgi:sec-independent protein translocase protein TatA